uniref:Calcineurin-like phosphoesterase domain-containing protein n=1 Tax=Chlorobium chlorochromatii (strain CaD3) TaxID=340177 RepID=Q3APN9_CHLCH
MKQPLKIAHISDIHLSGANDRSHAARLTRLLQHLRNEQFDHLVITGDLGNHADPDEWRVVQQLLKQTEWYHWERCTILPGNHDLMNLEEEMRLYNALNPIQWFRQKAFQRKRQLFCELFYEIMGGKNQTFPFLKILNYPTLRLALVALDSVAAWHPSTNPLGARGFIEPQQLTALQQPQIAEALRSCVVIGLCHHAYKVYGTDSLIDQAFDWTMELQNRDAFFSLMQQLGASIVLHGHFHRFQSYQKEGITFINGGCFRYNPYRYSELLLEADGSFQQQFLSLEEK